MLHFRKQSKSDKMKKLLLPILGLFLAATTLSAQADETLFNRNGMGLTGAWGGTIVGITSFQDDNAFLRGGFGGLEFGKSLFLGWGGVETTNNVFGQNSQSDVDLDYNGLIVGYGLNSQKVVHPQFMLMVGGGKAAFEKNSDNVFVIQPSAGVEINVFRWVRIGVNGGYRFVANSDLPTISDQDLSNFYGELRFKFGWSWGN